VGHEYVQLQGEVKQVVFQAIARKRSAQSCARRRCAPGRLPTPRTLEPRADFRRRKAHHSGLVQVVENLAVEGLRSMEMDSSSLIHQRRDDAGHVNTAPFRG
jgi:hypothetical protein